MPLYFSRPLRRVDYFLGKLGVIAVFLAAVAIVPAVLAYLLGVGVQPRLGGRPRHLAAARRRRSPTALVVVRLGGDADAGDLVAVAELAAGRGDLGRPLGRQQRRRRTSCTQTVRQDWCPLVSYTTNLDRVREALLDTASAREQVPRPLRGRAGRRPRTAVRPSRSAGAAGGSGPPPADPAGRPGRGPPPLPAATPDGNSAYPWHVVGRRARRACSSSRPGPSRPA